MRDDHTPGPWIATPDPDPFRGDDWCIGTEDQIDAVAVCSEKDAHLIAAAPKLLAVLEELVNTDGPMRDWDAPRAVIAQARGKST